MDCSLQRKIESAEKKNDTPRLRQLYDALTRKRSVSHYAQLTNADAARAAEVTQAAIARLTPTHRKKRIKKPVVLEFSDSEQSDLFYDLSRWPRKPYCTNDFEVGMSIRSLSHAIHKKYIQANPPNLRVWMLFDIDRAGAASAWETAHLPPPAWTAVNRENGHAHSAWGLTAPVLIEGLGVHDAPMRYLAAVEAMMREKLQADSGYSGLITKNPVHPVWQTLRGPRLAYTLSELAEALPGVEKFKLRGKVESVGLGRNVTLFDRLRAWAYRAIRGYWGGGLNVWNAWISACSSKALVLNGDFPAPLNGREVWHIAKSVATYTYAKTTQSGFSQWQSAQGTKGGKASGKVRATASEDKRASAKLMRTSGMTQIAIADELSVTERTIRNWLS